MEEKRVFKGKERIFDLRKPVLSKPALQSLVIEIEETDQFHEKEALQDEVSVPMAAGGDPVRVRCQRGDHPDPEDRVPVEEHG